MPVVAGESKTGAFYGTATYGSQSYGDAQFNILLGTEKGGAYYGTGVYGTNSYGDTTQPQITGEHSVQATVTVNAVSATIYAAAIRVAAVGTGVVNTDYTDKYTGFYVYDNYENALYGQGKYGFTRYGLTIDYVNIEVPAVTPTITAGDVIINAASVAEPGAPIAALVFTDAALVEGDEVVVVAEANVTPPSVEGTTAINDVIPRSNNTVPVSGNEATGAVTTVEQIIATATVIPPAGVGTGEIGTAFRWLSIYSVTGVEATATADGDSVIANNARPSILTVDNLDAPALVKTVTISTTTNIFDVSLKDHERTASVVPDKPRIVYVRAA